MNKKSKIKLIVILIAFIIILTFITSAQFQDTLQKPKIIGPITNDGPASFGINNIKIYKVSEEEVLPEFTLLAVEDRENYAQSTASNPSSATTNSLPLNSLTSMRTFSSSRNLGKFDITFSPNGFRSIFQSLSNHLLSNAGVAFQNLFNVFTSSYQFNNITNQDSSAFESGLSMTNFTIRNKVLANFNSHKANNDNSIFKAFENE